ncbi:hypothetical protein ACJ6WE_29125 [Streptomyces sp. MMS24-I31]|uniref:hypothetical protein n=1 Tax=Streptomyces sp. MMS24-I31 TaxID=3351563 RepID=UPI003896C1FC
MPRLWRPDTFGEREARAGWTWVVPALFALNLVVTACFLGRFGVEDVTEALAFTGNFAGLMMLVAAAVALVGAVAVPALYLRSGSSYIKLFALVGTATAFVANLMLMVSTVRDGESVPYTVLWCVLAPVSAWSVVAVYRTPVDIPAPKSVGVAAAVAALVAAANFGYNQLYQPYKEMPSPEVTVVLGDPVLSPEKKAFVLPVHFTFENRSDVGMYMLGSQFWVAGRDEKTVSSARSGPVWRTDFERGWASNRWALTPSTRIITFGVWMPDFGSWLAPHETFTTTRMVQLPIGIPYDEIRVFADMACARTDRMWVESNWTRESSWGPGVKHPGWVKKGFDFLHYRTRIRENNSIAEHTREPRYLDYWWLFGDNPGYAFPDITKKSEAGRNLTDEEGHRLYSRYGLARINSGYVSRSLWDLKRQAGSRPAPSAPPP